MPSFENKKKILLVVRWPVGGIRTYIRYVYRNFDPKEWEISIIAPNINEMKILIDDLNECDINYIKLDKKPRKLSILLSIIKELYFNNYDIVHSHGFTSGILTSVFAKILKVKHIMTPHDVFSTNFFISPWGKIKKRFISFSFSLIDVIQSVSFDAQENFLKFFPHLKNNCVVISNGVEVDRFYLAEPRDFYSELKIQRDVFLIGFLGRFMSQKGFVYLVDAVKILIDCGEFRGKFVVLCFGDGGFVRQERQQIMEKKLTSYFEFLPFSANPASAMKGLDLIVMPSLWEACPLQPMEALICGIPFIGTDCLGLREVLKNTPAKIVPRKSAADLAVAIKDELQSSSKDMFLNFRDTAANRFDVKNQYNSLISVYCRLLS